jgi:hypothetical protein
LLHPEGDTLWLLRLHPELLHRLPKLLLRLLRLPELLGSGGLAELGRGWGGLAKAACQRWPWRRCWGWCRRSKPSKEITHRWWSWRSSGRLLSEGRHLASLRTRNWALHSRLIS